LKTWDEMKNKASFEKLCSFKDEQTLLQSESSNLKLMLQVFCALGGFGDNEQCSLFCVDELQRKIEELDEKYGYFDQLYVFEAMDREPPVVEKESSFTERRGLLIGMNDSKYGTKPVVYCGPICLQDGKSVPCGSGTGIYMRFKSLYIMEGACEVLAERISTKNFGVRYRFNFDENLPEFGDRLSFCLMSKGYHIDEVFFSLKGFGMIIADSYDKIVNSNKTVSLL